MIVDSFKWYNDYINQEDSQKWSIFNEMIVYSNQENRNNIDSTITSNKKRENKYRRREEINSWKNTFEDEDKYRNVHILLLKSITQGNWRYHIWSLSFLIPCFFFYTLAMTIRVASSVHVFSLRYLGTCELPSSICFPTRRWSCWQSVWHSFWVCFWVTSFSSARFALGSSATRSKTNGAVSSTFKMYKLTCKLKKFSTNA